MIAWLDFYQFMLFILIHLASTVNTGWEMLLAGMFSVMNLVEYQIR